MGITSDEMLHAWRIGLQVVREEAYVVAEELGIGKDVVLTQRPSSTLTLSSTSVAELRAAGTTVGAFQASEPGTNHTFTYALVSGAGSTDNGSFVVSGNQLLTADAFDFAHGWRGLLRVRALREADDARPARRDANERRTSFGRRGARMDSLARAGSARGRSGRGGPSDDV